MTTFSEQLIANSKASQCKPACTDLSQPIIAMSTESQVNVGGGSNLVGFAQLTADLFGVITTDQFASIPLEGSSGGGAGLVNNSQMKNSNPIGQ